MLDRMGYLPEDPMSLHNAAFNLFVGHRDMQRGIAFTEGITLGRDTRGVSLMRSRYG
jgi:hypothetical protein